MKAKVSRRSLLEEAYLKSLRMAKLEEPLEEYRFASPRKWRFDFAWPSRKLAVEVEGGVFSGGRHTRGVGFEQDCRKYNAAAMDGWKVLRFTGSMVRDFEAMTATARALGKGLI